MWKIEVSVADDTVLGIQLDVPDWIEEDVVEKIAYDVVKAVKFNVEKYHNASSTLLVMKEEALV